MERKNTQVLLVSVMILVMAAEIAGLSPGACTTGCANRCRGSKNFAECYKDCISGCFKTSDSTLSYYCKLGCSLHECSKIADDAKLRTSCLEDCSNVKCKA